jgi:pimeloyl-ACP methyl ester carboxylesterase
VSWAELGSDASANVLVHAHGTGSSRLELAMYDGALAALGVRVIAPDRPGCGLSTGGEQPRTVAAWADDVAWLADQLAVEAFAVSGYSGGGPHALAVAASPSLGPRVTHVLLRAALAPGQGPRNAFDVEIREHARRLTWEGFRAWFAPPDDVEFAPADMDALGDPVFAETALATLAEGARQGTLGAAGDMWAFEASWGFACNAVDQRVDIWHGDEDRAVPVSHAYALRDELPNADVRVLAGEGHISIGRAVPEQLALVTWTTS